MYTNPYGHTYTHVHYAFTALNRMTEKFCGVCGVERDLGDERKRIFTPLKEITLDILLVKKHWKKQIYMYL